MNFERLNKCEDDRNWRDILHGDGKDSCDSMNPDFCTNHGEYSIEAKRACPRACGVCSYGNKRFWQYYIIYSKIHMRISYHFKPIFNLLVLPLPTSKPPSPPFATGKFMQIVCYLQQ